MWRQEAAGKRLKQLVHKKEKAEAGGDYKAAAAKCPHMAAAQAKKAKEEAKKAEDVKVDL